MYKIYADGVLIYDTKLQYDEQYILLSPVLNLEVNKAGSLEFLLPPSNLGYDLIDKLKTTIKVVDDEDQILFVGRVLHDERDFYNRKQVYCEGALSFLMDGVMRPYEYTGSVQDYFKLLLDTQNSQVDENRRVVYTIDADPVEDPNMTIVRSSQDPVQILTELNNKLLENQALGGYFIVEYHSDDSITCKYSNSYTSVSDQTIDFRENLLDIGEYISGENVFTVLIPLGAKVEGSESRVDIKSVNGGLDYIEDQTGISFFGRIWKFQIWDDVTLPQNLLTKGTAYLQQNIELSSSLTIKAVDLHYIDVDVSRIRLGDSVKVVSIPHGLDTFFMCSQIQLHFDDPSQDEFTFGTVLKGLTDYQIGLEKKGG